MAKNTNLSKAKKEKNDEFYTQMNDVELELKHYKEHFKNKVVLCNCNDPEWSAFWKYFHLQFGSLGLKKLIATTYNEEGLAYKLEYIGGNDNDIDICVKTPLEGDGDFRNKECLALLEECDVVVTNPPFSKFREYMALLMQYKKKFLIIGSGNAITYKEIFPLIRDNLMWLGVTRQGAGSMWFRVPNDTPEKKGQKIKDGIKYQTIGNSCWFTNLDHRKRHEALVRDLSEDYDLEKYPKYDNYDAINVDKVLKIPRDYYGVMGVPITFLGKYNPDEFEIVAFRKGEDGKDLIFTRDSEREFNRTFVSLYDSDCMDDKKLRRKNQWEDYLRKNNNQAEIEPIDYFYPRRVKSRAAGTMNGLIDGKETYRRILIQRKVGK